MGGDSWALPDRAPDHVWGGPGTGVRCAICGVLTAPDDMELELEFTRPGYTGWHRFRVHLQCFCAREAERRGVSGNPLQAAEVAAPSGNLQK